MFLQNLFQNYPPVYAEVNIEIYKNIILPVVLHGSETWSLTLREEHRLREFENTMLRRIFRQKNEGVAGVWRKLHNEERHNFYSSLSIIRMIKSRRKEWAGHVECMERREACTLLVGKP
jgi:hypothetical protein